MGTTSTASDAYAKNQSEIAQMLDLIGMELAKHPHKKVDGSTTWNMVGDLQLVRIRLIDSLQIISGMDRRAIEKFLEEAI